MPQAGQDLLTFEVLLLAELVAGKAENCDLVPELLSQLVQLRVVSGGGASVACHVEHKYHFALELGQRQRLSQKRFGLEFEQAVRADYPRPLRSTRHVDDSLTGKEWSSGLRISGGVCEVGV